MTLKYDPANHLYTLDGLPLPSVTQILGQFRRVHLGELKYMVDVFSGRIFPAEVFDHPAEAGGAIHQGAAYLLQGKGLRWDSLAPELVGPLRQFETWLQEYGVKPLLVETPLASRRWRYAGTPDAVVMLLGHRYLIDIKTGAQTWSAGPQTAAYERLYREHSGFTGALTRATLYLPKDGSAPRLRQEDGADDWEFFKARLTTFNYLNTRS
jgi:hypothetical protein